MPDRSNGSRLLVIALCTGLTAMLVWFGLDILGGSGPGDAASLDRQGGAVALAPGGGAELATSSPVNGAPGTQGAGAPEAREAVSEGGAGSTWYIENPGDALWVTGRVHLPLGTPADEELWIVAVSRPPRPRNRPGLLGLITGGADLRGWLEAERDLEHARAPVGRDGLFRLPFPKRAPRPHLDMDGRYVRFDAPLPVQPAADPEPVDLYPSLGGWIQGEVVVPGDATGPERDVAGGSVWLVPKNEGFSLNVAFDLPQIIGHAELRYDGSFEFRGITPEQTWIVTAQTPGLTVEQEDDVEVEAGGTAHVTLTPARGAGVSGVVVDDDGRPVQGAIVRAREGDLGIDEDFGLASLIGRQTISERDGGFFLGGLGAGEVRLEAERAGYRKLGRAKLELEEGQQVDDVVLKVRIGRTLAGRVTWPDGMPAAGAQVHAVKASKADGRAPSARMAALEALRDPKSATVADELGEFWLPGLSVGSHRLVAQASRNEPDGTWTDGRAELVEKPSEKGLVLTLEPVEVVAGTVLGPDDAPVPRFEVLVAERGHEDNLFGFLTTGEGGRRFEGKDGRFRLLGLPDGAWNLHVRAEGYSISRTLTFELPRALDEPDLEIRLNLAAGAAGLVLLPDGRPAAGARVIEHSEGLGIFNLARMMGGGAVPISAVSGPDGLFALEGLDAGTILVHAELRGYADSEPLELALVPGEVSGDHVLRLRLGGHITGEVLDREGSPLSGIEVDLSRDQNMEDRDTTTDSAGRFAFEGIQPGSHRLLATLREFDGEDGEWDWDAESVTVEVTEGQTVHVVLGGSRGEPVLVKGTVLASDEPVPNVSISITPASSDLFWVDGEWTRTDEAGEFEVELEAAGQYVATVSQRGYGEGGTELHFDVPQTPEHELVLELPTGRISGRVFGPDGGALEDFTVTLLEDGRLRRGGMRSQPWRSDKTNAQGEYEFKLLPPGMYTAQAGGSSMRLFFQGSRNPYGRSVHSGLRISEGDHLEHVDFDLADPSVATGTVVDEEGLPVASAAVFARNLDGAPVDMFSGARTDAAGHFEYKGLGPGSYTFHARKGDLSSRESHAIRVGPGTNGEVELVVVSATTLEVLLREPDGTAIPCELDVRDDAGLSMYGFVAMDSMMAMFGGGGQTLGHSVGPLPPGGYSLRATALDGRVATQKVHVSGQRSMEVELQVD